MSTPCRVALLLTLVCGVAAEARAADEARVLRLRAEQLAAEDHCEEALPRAREARALLPDDARAALVEGRCALRLGLYTDAIGPLEDARSLDPTLTGVSVDLVIAHYHADDRPAARAELERARVEAPDDARVALYEGLLLLEDSEAEDAAVAFEKAARMDRDVDPVASYYAGVAWHRELDRGRAEQALKRAKENAPDSQWAAQADLALTRMQQPYRSHHWVTLTAGMDYDSNVVLKGTGVVLPREISDEADGRGYWAFDSGYEFYRDPKWSLGVIGAYSGDTYMNLNQFNIQYPNVALWADRRIDEASWVRLQPFGGYAWRDGLPYVALGGGNLSYHRNFESAGAGRLFGAVVYNEYLFSIPDDPGIFSLGDFDGVGGSFPFNPSAAEKDRINQLLVSARDRTGVDYGAGYEHTLPVLEDTHFEATLRGGLGGGYYDSKGEEYEHASVRTWLGARKELPFELTLDLLGSYAHEPYRYASTFQAINEYISCVGGVCQTGRGPERRDNILGARVLLERPILPHVTAALRYRYHNNDSNTDVYNYDRHLVGGFVTIDFGS